MFDSPVKRPFLGVFQRPLTLILPKKYRDTNGSRIVIQIGGVYTTFCHREGILWQKYAIEMGGVSRYFFTCIGVRGRFDSPDFYKEWTNHRIAKSGKLANFVREPGFNLNSPTFSREERPNSGGHWGS